MRPQNYATQSHNMKSFEIPGLGGFMLANRTEDHQHFFQEGEEIACFGNINELRDQIVRYKSCEKKRKEMAKRAQSKVIEYHTYTKRAEQVLSLMKTES